MKKKIRKIMLGLINLIILLLSIASTEQPEQIDSLYEQEFSSDVLAMTRSFDNKGLIVGVGKSIDEINENLQFSRNISNFSEDIKFIYNSSGKLTAVSDTVQLFDGYTRSNTTFGGLRAPTSAVRSPDIRGTYMLTLEMNNSRPKIWLANDGKSSGSDNGTFIKYLFSDNTTCKQIIPINLDTLLFVTPNSIFTQKILWNIPDVEEENLEKPPSIQQPPQIVPNSRETIIQDTNIVWACTNPANDVIYYIKRAANTSSIIRLKYPGNSSTLLHETQEPIEFISATETSVYFSYRRKITRLFDKAVNIFLQNKTNSSVTVYVNNTTLTVSPGRTINHVCLPGSIQLTASSAVPVVFTEFNSNSARVTLENGTRTNFTIEQFHPKRIKIDESELVAPDSVLFNRSSGMLLPVTYNDTTMVLYFFSNNRIVWEKTFSASENKPQFHLTSNKVVVVQGNTLEVLNQVDGNTTHLFNATEQIKAIAVNDKFMISLGSKTHDGYSLESNTKIFSFDDNEEGYRKVEFIDENTIVFITTLNIHIFNIRENDLELKNIIPISWVGAEPLAILPLYNGAWGIITRAYLVTWNSIEQIEPNKTRMPENNKYLYFYNNTNSGPVLVFFSSRNRYLVEYLFELPQRQLRENNLSLQLTNAHGNRERFAVINERKMINIFENYVNKYTLFFFKNGGIVLLQPGSAYNDDKLNVIRGNPLAFIRIVVNRTETRLVEADLESLKIY